MGSLVYRIQNKQDRTHGPYDVSLKMGIRPDVVARLHDAHGTDSEHPSPHKDIGRSIEKNEYCGFATAVGLLSWFRGFIPGLLRAEFEIVALNNVTITAVGGYQVVFKWNDNK